MNIGIKIKILFLLSVLMTFQCTNEREQVTIHSIGDSTMADKKAEVYPETGWGQVLGEFFDETVTIENHAVNGRSTKSFIDEGRWDTVKEKLEKGDYVFIQFGHNDQKKKDTTRYTDPYGSFTQNLEKFIADTRAREAIPILFTPIVRRKLDENNHIIDTHGDYPEAVRRLAQNKQVPFIDLEKMTRKWIESLGDISSRQMFVWTEPTKKYPEGRRDDTHLSEEGAKSVAELVVRELEVIHSDLANRISN